MCIRVLNPPLAKGDRGVEDGCWDDDGGFRLALPATVRRRRGQPQGDCPYKRVQGRFPAEGFGVSPNFLTTPKIEDPPQEEWGIKGVERDHYGQSLGQHIRWIPCPETV